MLGLLLVVLVSALLPVPLNTIIGDVDDDKKITIRDAQLISKVSARLEPPNCASDYNGNGRTEITDALYVAQIVAGTRIHNQGTCSNRNQAFTCGDADGDGDVDSTDLNVITQYLSSPSLFTCDGTAVCPTTGLVCPAGEQCPSVVPIGFTRTCADTGFNDGTSMLPPNGILDDGDRLMIELYVGGYTPALSMCDIPCRDPSTIPPPVPFAAPSKPKAPFRAPARR